MVKETVNRLNTESLTTQSSEMIWQLNKVEGSCEVIENENEAGKCEQKAATSQLNNILGNENSYESFNSSDKVKINIIA